MRFLLLAPVFAVVALAATAPAAGAVPCNNTLTDSAGNPWSTGSTFSNMVTPAHTDYGSTGFGAVGAAYQSPDPNGCTLEDAAREVAYPPDPLGTTGVEGSIKAYVPAGPVPFVRYLQILHNPTASTITGDLQFNSQFTSAVTVQSSSSGDTDVTVSGDRWAVTTNSSPAVHFASIWDANFGTSPDKVDVLVGTGSSPFASGANRLVTRYQNVSIAPGETAVYMHVGLIRATPEATRDAADLAARGLLPVYEGMSIDEINALRNWPPPPTDADGDGKLSSADNCPSDTNPDQADADGDGIGDACDPDDDGDGLSDAVESTIGSNPRSTDSDGDGRPDNADACPTRAAATGDGCPEAPAGRGETLTLPPDTTPAKLALSGFASKLKLKAFLKGLNVTATTDEPVALDFQLTTTLNGARVLLAESSLDRAGGARTVKLKPSKRALGRARRLTLKLKVVATDAGGNRTVLTRSVKVAP